MGEEHYLLAYSWQSTEGIHRDKALVAHAAALNYGYTGLVMYEFSSYAVIHISLSSKGLIL